MIMFDLRFDSTASSMFKDFVEKNILRNITLELADVIKIKRTFNPQYACTGEVSDFNKDEIVLSLDYSLLAFFNEKPKQVAVGVSTTPVSQMQLIIDFLKTQKVGLWAGRELTIDSLLNNKLLDKIELIERLLPSIPSTSRDYIITSVHYTPRAVELKITSQIAKNTLDSFMKTLLNFLDDFKYKTVHCQMNAEKIVEGKGLVSRL